MLFVVDEEYKLTEKELEEEDLVKIKKYKKIFDYSNANTLLLISSKLEIKDKWYIFSKKIYCSMYIKKIYINEDTIQVEIKVDYDNIISLKKKSIYFYFYWLC